MSAITCAEYMEQQRLNGRYNISYDEVWDAAIKHAEALKPTHNTGSPKFCQHWQVYNCGCSGEFGACDCNGNLVLAKLRAGA